jgi:hypothetical protein
MRMIASVVAAALALGLSAGASLADDEDVNNAPAMVTIDEPATTLFDLGIDVVPVAKTPAAVRAYLGSLLPLTRDVLLSTCAHYRANPGAVEERDTLEFCALAVAG